MQPVERSLAIQASGFVGTSASVQRTRRARTTQEISTAVREEWVAREVALESSGETRTWRLGLPPWRNRPFDPKAQLRHRVLAYGNPHTDGTEDGFRPTRRAIEDALAFIDLLPATVLLPNVALAEDGEINFYWRSSGLFIDVGFVGDGRMYFFANVDNYNIDLDGSVRSRDRSLPRELLDALPPLWARSQVERSP